MSNTSPQVGPAYTKGGSIYSCDVYQSSVSDGRYRVETTKRDTNAPEMVDMEFNSLDMAKKYANTVADLATGVEAQAMIDAYTKA